MHFIHCVNYHYIIKRNVIPINCYRIKMTVKFYILRKWRKIIFTSLLIPTLYLFHLANADIVVPRVKFFIKDFFSKCDQIRRFFVQCRNWLNWINIQGIIQIHWFATDCIFDLSKAVTQRCSVKKVFLEISQNSQEKIFAGVSFLIKVRASAMFLPKSLRRTQTSLPDFYTLFLIRLLLTRNFHQH